MAAFDLAAKLGAQRLLAIADAKDRHARLKHRLRGARRVLVQHRSRAAREDHAFRLQLGEGFCRRLERVDFAIDTGLAHAPRNQLRDLAAEINDEDGLVLAHGEPLGNLASRRNAWVESQHQADSR